MKVKDLLNKIRSNCDVQIVQMSIAEIDPIKVPVIRQQGEAFVLLNSNNNYLDFKVIEVFIEEEYLSILCVADHIQKERIIEAYKS